jgi:hypothetical protein
MRLKNLDFSSRFQVEQQLTPHFPSTGLHHQEVARLIAESFARRDRNEIEFLVVEAKKSNLEPKPTALIFLEA